MQHGDESEARVASRASEHGEAEGVSQERGPRRIGSAAALGLWAGHAALSALGVRGEHAALSNIPHTHRDTW